MFLIGDSHSNSLETGKLGGDLAARLDRLFAAIQAAGVRKIIVVGQTPTWDPDIPHLVTQDFIKNDQQLTSRMLTGIVPASLSMDAMMRNLPFPSGVSYLSIKDTLCDAAGCLTGIGPNPEAEPVVWDYGHLTSYGSAYVANTLLKDALEKALGLGAEPAASGAINQRFAQ